MESEKVKYDQKLCQYLFNRFGMKRRRKMLDVGCGVGSHVKAFRKLGLHVWGVDRVCKGHFTKTIDLENEALPFPAETFDYVFCKSVLEHIQRDSHVKEESLRVLKKGGLFIVMTPLVNKYWETYPEHINPIVPQWDTNPVWGGYIHFYQFPFVWKYPFLKFIPKIIALFVPDRFRFHKDGTQNVLVRHSKEPVWLIWVWKCA